MTIQGNLNNMALKVEYCAPAIMIYIDAIQMKQVLINLIQNAFEAMPSGGEGDISLAYDVADTRYIVIGVTDTGIGINRRAIEGGVHPFFYNQR